MNTVSFTPNCNYSLYNANNRNNKPAFKGAIGDSIVAGIEKGTEVNPSKIIEQVKGKFGLNGEKVKDVIESMLDKVKSLTETDKYLDRTIKEGEEKVQNLTEKKQNSIKQAEESLENTFLNGFKRQEKQMAEKEAKIAELKEFSAGFDGFKIKSAEEVEGLMPDAAIETMKSMVETKDSAADSMLKFLFTGEQPTEAIDWLNKGTQLHKTYRDGVFDIPEVRLEWQKYGCKGAASNTPINNTIDLIETALKGNPKGSYILCSSFDKQITANALAIVEPLCKNKEDFGYAQRNLEKAIKESKDYHKNFGLAKEKVLRKRPQSLFEIDRKGYSLSDSVIIEKNKEGEKLNEWSLSNFAYYVGYNG